MLLTRASLLQLTEALASNTTVTSLDLSHNSITSVGAKVPSHYPVGKFLAFDTIVASIR